MFGDMSYHHHCWPVHPDIATLSARVAQLEEALRETLEIARRNEDGDYVTRALAALQEQGGGE